MKDLKYNLKDKEVETDFQIVEKAIKKGEGRLDTAESDIGTAENRLDMLEAIYNSRIRAYLSINQDIVHLAVTVVQFDTESYDNLGEWNMATYRFVPAVTGYYHISTNVVFNELINDQVFGSLRVFKNGAGTEIGVYNSASGAMNLSFSISGDLYLLNTDYIDVRIYQRNGNNREINKTLSQVSIHRIA